MLSYKNQHESKQVIDFKVAEMYCIVSITFQDEHFDVSKTWWNTDFLSKDRDYVLYHLLWSQNYGFSVVLNLRSSSVTTAGMKCREYIIPKEWYSI